MELLHTDQQQERTDITQRRFAEEIYAEISLAIQRLLEVDGLYETHSTVVELRDEQEIARRALTRFNNKELTAEAA